MTLNIIGEVPNQVRLCVHLETECRDCFSTLASEQESSQSVFFFGALEYWTSPMLFMNSVVHCQQSILLMQEQQVGPGSVSHPSLWASFLSVHLPNFSGVSSEITEFQLPNL